jgi:hypothetical protein
VNRPVTTNIGKKIKADPPPKQYIAMWAIPVYVTGASGPNLLNGSVIVKGPLANILGWVRPMTRTKVLPMAIALVLFALPAFAQGKAKAPSGKEMAAKETPAQEITGTVQSFSGNILDIKPPTVQPAVWVTIPESMKVDRAALKPGVEVSVEARWATVTYLALKPPKIMPAKKSSAQ